MNGIVFFLRGCAGSTLLKLHILFFIGFGMIGFLHSYFSSEVLLLIIFLWIYTVYAYLHFFSKKIQWQEIFLIISLYLLPITLYFSHLERSLNNFFQLLPFLITALLSRCVYPHKGFQHLFAWTSMVPLIITGGYWQCTHIFSQWVWTLFMVYGYGIWDRMVWILYLLGLWINMVLIFFPSLLVDYTSTCSILESITLAIQLFPPLLRPRLWGITFSEDWAYRLWMLMFWMPFSPVMSEFNASRGISIIIRMIICGVCMSRLMILKTSMDASTALQRMLAGIATIFFALTFMGNDPILNWGIQAIGTAGFMMYWGLKNHILLIKEPFSVSTGLFAWNRKRSFIFWIGFLSMWMILGICLHAVLELHVVLKIFMSCGLVFLAGYWMLAWHHWGENMHEDIQIVSIVPHTYNKREDILGGILLCGVSFYLLWKFFYGMPHLTQIPLYSTSIFGWIFGFSAIITFYYIFLKNHKNLQKDTLFKWTPKIILKFFRIFLILFRTFSFLGRIIKKIGFFMSHSWRRIDNFLIRFEPSQKEDL